MAELEEQRMTVPVDEARCALEAFSNGRGPMTVQAQVCWLADHFPGLTQKQMALVLSVSQQMVSRNLTVRAEQLDRARALKAVPLRATKTDGYVLLKDFPDGCDNDDDRIYTRVQHARK